MPDDSLKQRSLETFLRRNLADNTKSLADIKAMSLDAFARMNDGTTVVEVVIEGGSTRAQVNCSPEIVLAACENIIAETDPANALAKVSNEQRYADFSGGCIQT